MIRAPAVAERNIRNVMENNYKWKKHAPYEATGFRSGCGMINTPQHRKSLIN